MLLVCLLILIRKHGEIVRVGLIRLSGLCLVWVYVQDAVIDFTLLKATSLREASF